MSDDIRLRVRPDELVRQTSIPTLAKQAEVNERTLRRHLLSARARDLLDPSRDSSWMWQTSRGKAWRVNVHRLRAAHPELFGLPPPEELDARVEDLQMQVRELRKKINALYAAFREHRQEHSKTSV